jgi:hypothetical protein
MTKRLPMWLLIAAALSACNISQVLDSSGPDGTVASAGPGEAAGPGGSTSGGTFTFQAINPAGRDRWDVVAADRDETYLWALYESPDNSRDREFWRLDFASRQWLKIVAGDIVDIEPGLYLLRDGGGGKTHYKLSFTGGVDVGMELFNDALVPPALTGVTIVHGEGLHSATIMIFTGSRTVFRQTGGCCPEQWEEIRNDATVVSPGIVEPLDGIWGGLPGSGGAVAKTGRALWDVTPFEWSKIAGVGSGPVELAFDRVDQRLFGTEGCSLFEVVSSSAVVLDAAAGSGAFGDVLCDFGFSALPLDTDGPNIYLPFGMTYTTTGTLRSSWLGTPDINGDDAVTQLLVFNQAYQPRYLFTDPTATGDSWVYQRAVIDEYADVPAGWLRIQNPLIIPWKDPHPAAQN